MTDQEMLIRQAISAEAAEAVDSRVVLAELQKRKSRKRLGTFFGVAGLTVAAAATAVIVPMAVKHTTASPGNAQTGPVYVLVLRTTDFYGEQKPRDLLLTRIDDDGSLSVLNMPGNYNISRQQLRHPDMYRVHQIDKTLDDVEELTGIRPDHYVAITTETLGELATIVGGVDICIKPGGESAMSKYQSDLKPGKHTVGADNLREFLDARLSDSDNHPYSGRQRAFLSGFAAKLGNGNAGTLAREVNKSAQFDEGFDVLAYARRFQRGVPIRTMGLWHDPSLRVNPTGHDHDFLPEKVRPFVQRFFAGEDVPGAQPGPGQGETDGCVY